MGLRKEELRLMHRRVRSPASQAASQRLIKAREHCPFGHPGGTSPAGTPDFTPVGLILDFWWPDCRTLNLHCFSVCGNLWQQNKKLMRVERYTKWAKLLYCQRLKTHPRPTPPVRGLWTGDNLGNCVTIMEKNTQDINNCVAERQYVYTSTHMGSSWDNVYPINSWI